MRVVALYRVSSEKQEAEGASLDAQQRRYRELAAAHGWQTVAEYRGTESATQAARERQVLQRVLATIRDESVDAVWVYEQSRLTRGDELEVALLARELREREIAVYVDRNRIDLSDPAAGMVFGIVGLVDRHEVQRFKKRVAAGREEKARQGKRAVGRAPFGYRNPPPGDPRRGTLQVVEEEAAVVRRIFALSAAGSGRREVARALNVAGIKPPLAKVWDKGSVACILRNRAYLGEAVARAWVYSADRKTRRFDVGNARAIVCTGAHEAIIDPGTWERAHARDGRRGGRPDLLTGLLWVDGKRVAIARLRDRNLYRPAGGGSGVGVDADESNQLVWQGLLAQLRHPAALLALLTRSEDVEGLAAVEDEVTGLERQAGRLRARGARLTDMRADGEIDGAEYRARRDDTACQLRELEERILARRRQLAAVRDGHAVHQVLALARLVATAKLGGRQKRSALLTLVDRIDATVRDRGPQRKTTAGHWMRRKECRWGLGDVYLRLRGGGLAASVSSSDRSYITVQVVCGGRVVEPTTSAAGADVEVAR